MVLGAKGNHANFMQEAGQGAAELVLVGRGDGALSGWRVQLYGYN